MMTNKLILLLLLAHTLSSKNINDYDNILHLRPVSFVRNIANCTDCISVNFILMDVIKSNGNFKNYDTICLKIGRDHYENFYSTNIFNMLNDYLVLINRENSKNCIKYFQSINIGYHSKDILDDSSLVKVNKFIDTNIKLIYLIENKDSITQELFPNNIKVRGHKLNWLEHNLTKDFLDTNKFDYISLDLLKNYLDSLKRDSTMIKE